MSLGRYYHTLRHLRPVQFYGRIAHRLHRPRPDLRPPPSLRTASQPFPLPPIHRPSLLGPTRFEFLNLARDVTQPPDWNDPATEKLWLYNLHYFDDLNARGRDERATWHPALIGRWIAENPPGHGNGWEPYPLSLRVVNWAQWALAGHTLSPEAAHSLAVQARFLMQRLEWHLLGNHLWKNGKALVFAGAFFAGPEADRWRATGLRIIEEQLGEQVLPDGGHFERSPMYHAIALGDLLDLLALSRCYPHLIDAAVTSRWKATASAMLRWLEVMTHPDGDIAFFNDAALGVAATPAELRSLMGVLDIEPARAPEATLTHLDPSGYVRMTAGDWVVLADVGPIGPDYIPGHAHADTLSFELSWRGKRVFSNSGTSRYGTGPQRELERGTAAHNSLTVDGENSTEVWHGFRVARRARPTDLRVQVDEQSATVSCAHDGYRRLAGHPVHRREWGLAAGGLQIHDQLSGSGEHEAVGYLHVHPGVTVRRAGDLTLELWVHDAGRLQVTFEPPVTVELHEGFLGQEFGLIRPRPVIAWRRQAPLPFASAVTITP